MSKRKPIFDEIKRARGGAAFTADMVASIDALLDALGITDAEEVPHDRRVGVKGLELIKRREGCHKKLANGLIQAYPDPATGGAPWTIGWGSTGPGIGPGTTWTQEQADAKLTSHVAEFAEHVSRAIGDAPTTQEQFDAMVSLCYNIGPTNFGKSTLVKKHKAQDYDGAAAQFAVWNKAAGKVMKGLTNRRADEAALYRSGRP